MLCRSSVLVPALPALLGLLTSALLLLGSALPLAAAPPTTSSQASVSPYAGQEQRRIKSLSEEDLQALRNGEGWGLAKAAELNGMPGPVHLLALREDIPLHPPQVRALEALYARMNGEARAQGARLIALEEELEAAFAEGSVTAPQLRALLEQIEQVRGELRYVHLAAHLETPALLSTEQIARYNALRGYALGSAAPGLRDAAVPGAASGHSGHGGHTGHGSR